MAVQIRYPDGSFQWLPGVLYQERDGFSVYDRHANPKYGQHSDFGNDHQVISRTDDERVTDWSRRWSDPGGGTGNSCWKSDASGLIDTHTVTGEQRA